MADECRGTSISKRYWVDANHLAPLATKKKAVKDLVVRLGQKIFSEEKYERGEEASYELLSLAEKQQEPTVRKALDVHIFFAPFFCRNKKKTLGDK